MYVRPNFKTKKALKEAVAAGERVELLNPGIYGSTYVGPDGREGEISVEGPHYPQPHSWYARVQVAKGCVVKVK